MQIGEGEKRLVVVRGVPGPSEPVVVAAGLRPPHPIVLDGHEGEPHDYDGQDYAQEEAPGAEAAAAALAVRRGRRRRRGLGRRGARGRG